MANALYVLSALVTVLSGAMLLPAFTAIGRHEYEIAVAFSGSALAGAFLGGGLMLALQGAQRPALMRENLLLLVLAWIVLSAFGAIPLVTSGILVSPTDALFEAASALTTTGATLLGSAEDLSPAIVLWQAELQWLGGFGTLLMAATILSALGTGGTAVQRTLLPLGDTGQLFDRFFNISGGLSSIYLIATAIGFFAIWAGGVPRFEAFCLALSGIATGGLSLSSEGFAAYHAPVAEIALMALMLFGAMSFLVHWSAWRGGLRRYLLEPEFWLLLAMCALAALLLASGGGVHDVSGASFVVFNAVSLVTTSGFWVGPEPSSNAGFILGAIALAFAGGASGSTAGGLKLMRLWLMVAHARAELRRLAHPRSIHRVRFRGQPLADEVMRGVWAFFVAYVAVLAVTVCALAGFGLPLVSAFAAAVSAISNTGPLLIIVAGDITPYESLPTGAKWLLTAVMIAGRLEVMALIALLTPRFWRT